MKIAFITLMFSFSAQAANFYLCKEVKDPDSGFLLRTTDKPVSYKRYTAMMKPFSLCGYATDKEFGCRGGEGSRNFGWVWACDNKTIKLYGNLDGEVTSKRRIGRSERTESVRCDRLSFDEFSREREQLSHCR